MTRINVAILPQELPNNLLLAELREIKRIPNMVRSGKAVIKDIPEEFKLGSGHVKFFYDKGLYTLNRYLALYEESKRRNLNTQDFSEAWEGYPKDLMNDYSEKPRDRELLINRIVNEKGFNLIPIKKPDI